MGKLPGKVLIDATNSVRSRPEHYPTAYHAFAALSEGDVVKCFNTTGFENMENPKYGETAIDVYMSGDSLKAKQIARQLTLDAGFAECYDLGGADKVLLQEQFSLFLLRHRTGRQTDQCINRAKTNQACQYKNSAERQQDIPEGASHCTGEIQRRKYDGQNDANDLIGRTHVLFHNNQVFSGESIE